ncbi:MAG TPA: T9SS type A sorting domain-containing protein, partial [Ferruginibacter sp.]|nr:T9SS type A sorting domain-containing protein [Ferruginibacter sp.]
GPCTSVQLPVTLKSFGVRCYGNKVIVNWVTTNEFNSSHFVLQRSIDGVAWIDLGSIQAAGNSGVEQTYNFIDNLPLLNGVYRLAQYDIDGRFHHSPVVKGGCIVQDEFTVWPNPAPDKVIVSIQSSIASTGMIRVFDSKAVVVRSGRVMLIRGLNRFELSVVDLAGGIYIVQIQNADGVSRNAIMVKR